MPDSRVDLPRCLGPRGYHAEGAKTPFFLGTSMYAITPQVVLDSQPPKQLFDDVDFLPFKQLERLAGPLALAVVQERLKEPHRPSRRLFVEVVVKPLGDCVRF